MKSEIDQNSVICRVVRGVVTLERDGKRLRLTHPAFAKMREETRVRVLLSDLTIWRFRGSELIGTAEIIPMRVHRSETCNAIKGTGRCVCPKEAQS